MMETAKPDIDAMNFPTVNYARLESSVAAWAKYKFLSYGHPQMIALYQDMLSNGGSVPQDRIKDIVLYMKMSGSFAFQNKHFKDALKWFSRMNWVFEHEFARNVQQKEMRQYFGMITDRYCRLMSVLEDTDLWDKC